MFEIKPDVRVEPLLAEIARDPRVQWAGIKAETEWSWDRNRRAEGIEYRRAATLEIQANTTGHGAGGRGIPAADRYGVARLLITDGDLVTHVELVHGAPYGLVDLVAKAIG